MQSTTTSELPQRANGSVSIIRTVAEFDQLQSEWDELLARSEATLFQSFEWQRTWWKCFAEPNNAHQLCIIVVREGPRLVAIAPFFIERCSLFGVLSFQRLSFIAREISDYLDMICERGREDAIASFLVSTIASLQPQCDVLLFADIPNHSRFHSLLHDGLSRNGFEGTRLANAQCPRTELKQTWEATVESFSKKHRKDISYELRNINRNFSAAFELISAREDVANGIKDFIAMHQERWTLAGHTGVFRDTQQADFHRAVAASLFDRGWLFLAFLTLNGKRVAVNYGFRFGETLSTYLNGMIDLGEIAKYSPGKVLHELSMQKGIENGARVYDFMRGRERYKYALNAADVPNWTLLMYRNGSLITRLKFKLYLLQAAFQRRARKELTMAKHITSEHGWFSRATANHLKSRILQNTRDSVRKVKDPEKALPESEK